MAEILPKCRKTQLNQSIFYTIDHNHVVFLRIKLSIHRGSVQLIFFVGSSISSSLRICGRLLFEFAKLLDSNSCMLLLVFPRYPKIFQITMILMTTLGNLFQFNCMTEILHTLIIQKQHSLELTRCIQFVCLSYTFFHELSGFIAEFIILNSYFWNCIFLFLLCRLLFS